MARAQTVIVKYVKPFFIISVPPPLCAAAELIGNKCPFWKLVTERAREGEDVYLDGFRALAGSACSHYITLQLPPSFSLRSREDVKEGAGQTDRWRTEKVNLNKEIVLSLLKCPAFHLFLLSFEQNGAECIWIL